MLPGSTAGGVSGSDLASSGWRDRPVGPALALFPASFPELALRRCEESQKQAVEAAQAVYCLLALAPDLRWACSLVTPVDPESAMVLKRSDSAGSLSAHWASRKVLQWAKRQPLWKASRRAGLAEPGFFPASVHWGP